MGSAGSFRRATGLALAGVGLPAVAHAPVSVFGIALGQPLALPPCSTAKFFGNTSDVTEITQQRFCATKLIQITNSPFQRSDLIFPEKQKPSVVSVNLASAYIWKGKVEAVDFATPDYNYSTSVLDGLKAKFGQPSYTRIGRSVVEGIPIPSLEAHWTLSGATVDYKAVDDGDIDNGYVSIKSDTYTQIEGDAAVAAEKAKIGL